MKIVILEGHAVNPGDLSWKFLEKYGEVTVYDNTLQSDVIRRTGNAEIILVNKLNITEEIIEKCPNLKLICVLATGYNSIDCRAASKRGIPVCNVPTYSTASVAQFTFALLLELCHQVGQHSKTVHEGKWTNCPYFCYWDSPQIELSGKTMGIVGFGKIGRAVGKIAKTMGMRVLAYNPSRCVEGEEIGTYVELDTLLNEADVISLHCPLKPENTGLINKETIRKMKKGAILINTARGPLIDEQALAEALNSGKLMGAAMDVVSQEPIKEDNPLLKANNCIITPHMAWSPKEARERILSCTEESIKAFLSGNPVNTVN